jgi:hypothetical protein
MVGVGRESLSFSAVRTLGSDSSERAVSVSGFTYFSFLFIFGFDSYPALFPLVFPEHMDKQACAEYFTRNASVRLCVLKILHFLLQRRSQ